MPDDADLDAACGIAGEGNHFHRRADGGQGRGNRKEGITGTDRIDDGFRESRNAHNVMRPVVDDATVLAVCDDKSVAVDHRRQFLGQDLLYRAESVSSGKLGFRGVDTDEVCT